MFLSTIDHFASNRTLYNLIAEAGVVHAGDNPSNHSPIFAKIVFDVDTNYAEVAKSNKRVNWEKSTVEARNLYSKTLDEKLVQLHSPGCVDCRNVRRPLLHTYRGVGGVHHGCVGGYRVYSNRVLGI